MGKKTNHTEEIEVEMECANCGCEIDDSDAMYAETSKGKWEDVEPYDSTRQYYYGRTNAIKACVAAIEQGFLRQDGCYDADGKPTYYR